jgi:hypothetical protein
MSRKDRGNETGSARESKGLRPARTQYSAGTMSQSNTRASVYPPASGLTRVTTEPGTSRPSIRLRPVASRLAAVSAPTAVEGSEVTTCSVSGGTTEGYPPTILFAPVGGWGARLVQVQHLVAGAARHCSYSDKSCQVVIYGYGAPGRIRTCAEPGGSEAYALTWSPPARPFVSVRKRLHRPQ